MEIRKCEKGLVGVYIVQLVPEAVFFLFYGVTGTNEMQIESKKREGK